MKIIDILSASWPKTGPAHGLLSGVKMDLSLEGEGQSARLRLEMTYPDGSQRTVALPIQRLVYHEGENTMWWEEDLARENRFAEGYQARLDQLARRQQDADQENKERRERLIAEEQQLRLDFDNECFLKREEWTQEVTLFESTKIAEREKWEAEIQEHEGFLKKHFSELDETLDVRRQLWSTEMASLDQALDDQRIQIRESIARLEQEKLDAEKAHQKEMEILREAHRLAKEAASEDDVVVG